MVMIEFNIIDIIYTDIYIYICVGIATKEMPTFCIVKVAND